MIDTPAADLGEDIPAADLGYDTLGQLRHTDTRIDGESDSSDVPESSLIKNTSLVSERPAAPCWS